MSEIYIVIIVLMGILATLGLFVGVTNDAVNFLNSAIGSRAASIRTILAVASVGILIGVITSNGMMEVARSGMFDPSMFTFHEVMILYLAVMFANIILLDLYNSWGLPTSTTVSLIFCLLGAAVAVSMFKIGNSMIYELDDLGDFINTSRAMGIVSAILLSVVIAFSCGSVIMYISRIIFSFRYNRTINKFGALWCGISLTAIIYFAVFKGLKNTLYDNPIIMYIDKNLLTYLVLCWIISSFILFVLQRFKINILRITILSGTFALALSFAGNDLVNFIGVPIAGFDAYSIAQAAGDTNIHMSALAKDSPANFLFLLSAGAIMIITLWSSNKAMHVTETELSLAAKQDDGELQYGSSPMSRTIVRTALNIGNGINKVIPCNMNKWISTRFTLVDIEHSGAPFDMIRATVNLTTAALLISMATSLKLPLSTTYVCFMVAMGSSLADKAWGRESAVYRITGVMTVVAGWFITALGGFLIALTVGLILIYGGTAAFVGVTIVAGWMLYHSNKPKKKTEADEADIKKERTIEGIIDDVKSELCNTMKSSNIIYESTLKALMEENRKELKSNTKQADELFGKARSHKYALLPTLRILQEGDANNAQYYVQIVDYINEMTKALVHITRPAFEHIDNNHEGLTNEQTHDLMKLNHKVETIHNDIYEMLISCKFNNLERVLSQRDELFLAIDENIKNEINRINEGKTKTRASMLYLKLLSETKNMILQSRNLLKIQALFVGRQCKEN